MVFCSVLLLILPPKSKAWYMSVLFVILHEKDNSALNFCAIETPSPGWGGLFLQLKDLRLFTQDRERGEEANREQPADTRVEELQTAIIGMESRYVHSWCCSQRRPTKEFQQRYFNVISGALSRSGVPWIRKFGYLCIQGILVLTTSFVRTYVHLFMLADVKWTSMLWLIDSCQKKVQVSADRCHIEVMYFLKLSADQFLVLGPFLKGGIQFASCLWQNVDNLRKKFHKISPRELSFSPGLNLFTMWGFFVEKLSKGGFPLSRNVYVRTQVKFTGVNSTEDDYECEI